MAEAMLAETMESNVGKWDRWYSGLDVEDPQPFGAADTYEIGAAWLAPCKDLEDWGCGKGWFRQYVTGRYTGVDGSQTPFADTVADLATYKSKASGIFMRHVVEHDRRWRDILANAVASFRQRLVIVVFTPLTDGHDEVELAYAEDPGVPDLSLPRSAFAAAFDGLEWSAETLATATQYGAETVFTVERPRASKAKR